MCEEFHKDGTTNITCIDLSTVAAYNMHKQLLSPDEKVSLLNDCLLFAYSTLKSIGREGLS